MNFKHFLHFYLFLYLIFITNGDLLSDMPLSINNNSIVIYPNEMKKCKMYDDACYFTLKIEKGIAIENLNAEIEDKSRAFVLNIVSCDQLNKTALNLDYSFECSKINKFDNYDLHVVQVSPQLIGYTSLIVSSNLKDKILTTKQYLVVQEPKRFVDKIFLIYVWTLNVVVACVMGLLLDLQTIKKFITMPIPVGIGFICQYLFMPLLAYGIVTLFNFGKAEAFSLFLYGCSPGGTQSNQWTILFDGNIDLSAVMTFCSTVASLFMMPAWVYSLGSILSTKANIEIPFISLFINLLVTVVPLLIGLAVSTLVPKARILANRFAKNFLKIVLLSFFVLIFSTRFFIFKLLTLQSCTSVLIPWLGFTLGAFVPYLLGYPRPQVLTICFETGFQNMGVAFLIIRTNFPSPESDIAFIPLVSVAFLVQIPFLFILLGQFMNGCFKNKPIKEEVKDEIKIEETDKMIENL